MDSARAIQIDKPALRRLASRLATKIQNYKRTHKLYPLGTRHLFFTQELFRTVRGGTRKLLVSVSSNYVSDLTIRPVISANVKVGKVGPELYFMPYVRKRVPPTGLYMMTIEINGGPALYDRKQWVESLYSTLIHEASHGAEVAFLPKKGVYKPRSPSGLLKTFMRKHALLPGEPISRDILRNIAYYNSPTEVRAYGQQVVDEVLRAVIPTASITSNLIDRALSLRSKVWERILFFLTPKNENHIRKMVWRALTDRRRSMEG